ncbi:hypothetical protein TRFO_10359 [Tritrichomonas foetus]|uniref:AIR9-like A9 domain-containing protein n=1 Tax=Tritrichomonas foetus TaxID=1144522 RepID=A0A1J4JEM7_9EUKA|nr:hypothetical protein TRFO_10359 [Tritrichomonas foetus]|eukprot:OHS95716.1 hypothetical protein TRFO_10359 [Tritrichomonas foetus]
MHKTPTRIPQPGASKTPKKSSQITSDLNSTAKVEGKISFFSELASQRHARILRLSGSNINSFQGLKNFPNVRIINLQNNPVDFTLMSVLVAFRSLSIQTVSGVPVEHDDHVNSFNYSGLVTHALRQGMDPSLVDEDPSLAFTNALDFLHQYPDLYIINDQKITVKVKGDLYTWYILDEEFQWRPIEGELNTIVNPMNFPLRCEIKNASFGKGESQQVLKSMSVLIPEHDKCYHMFCELSGNAAEGDIISVKAPLSSTIEWKHLEDDSLIRSGTLVLPLTPDDVGHNIVCEVTPGPELPSTRLISSEVKPGEFRFKSLRLQGQLVENDEIEFDISTKGTRATFKGIRILRSARHGDWENIAFIQRAEDGALKYKLTVQDIGCVIRAVCITEGGGPPLMLTSSERVQPSAPRFTSGNIFGSMLVGMPIFAIANYEGGVQGNCRYEWSIGGSKSRPVIVPSDADTGKKISCIMTPIRSDGSIGQPIEVTNNKPITNNAKPMVERFLAFHKRTRTGKLQMSFVEKRPSEQLFVIHEKETIIVSTACDWAVVDSKGIHTIGQSKVFTAETEYIKGIVVLFTDTFFAIAGVIEAATPTANDVSIVCDKASAFLSASYLYSGGIEGRSIIQWNRNEGRGEVVAAFGKSFHIGLVDRGCTFRAIVTPVSLDGKRGVPTPSEPFLIDDSCITTDEKPVLTILPPDVVLYDTEINVVFQEDPMPDPEHIAYAVTSLPLTNRHKVIWQINNRTVKEGNSFTPSVNDIGKVIKICVIDRIRKETISSVDLPPVDSEDPSVENVRLTIEKVQNDEKKWVNRVTVFADFHGGIEGKSIIIWKGIKPGETEETECARNNRKWIEINETWDNAKIGVEYIPMNTTSDNPGHSVRSEFYTVPPLNTKPPKEVGIKSHRIVPNKEYTQLTCEVETIGKCSVLYDWGYIFENERQYTDETTKVHKIVQDDFEFPLFCGLRVLDDKNRPIAEEFCDLLDTASPLFDPKVFKATIMPAEKPTDVKQDKNQEKELLFTHGQELKVVLNDYQGPPITSKSVRWERKFGDSWKKIIESETYTTTMNDFNCDIRAVINIVVKHRVLDKPRSCEYTTPEVRVSGKNKIIRRMAKALKRTKRAVFEARMPLGEKVTILFENGNLILKNGANILLRSPFPTVALEIYDSQPSTLALRARHGYNTELTFSEKKMSGGTKFSAAQTRELFYRALNRFQKGR